MKSALSSIRDAVREGASLAEALKANPKAFSTLYVNIVSAGEASGTLEVTLDRLADFLDEQVRFRGKFTAALAYPVLMTVIGVGVLFFLFSFVLPRVVGMFSDCDWSIHFCRRAPASTIHTGSTSKAVAYSPRSSGDTPRTISHAGTATPR